MVNLSNRNLGLDKLRLLSISDSTKVGGTADAGNAPLK